MEIIKPIMNCTLGVEYLTKNTSAVKLRKYGHAIVSIKCKDMNIPGFKSNRKLSHIAITSDILKKKEDTKGEFQIRETYRCSLCLPEHRVNDAGFDGYLSEIQHIIDTSKLIPTNVRKALHDNPTSTYHIVNVSKLVTRNLKTGQVCEWKPTETITGKSDKITVLVLTAVDGEKLEDVPETRKTECWDAAGAIAIKACHMVSKTTHNLSCSLVAKNKAKKIK